MSIKVRSYQEYSTNSMPSKIIDDGVVDHAYNIPLVGKFVSGYSIEYARSILWSIEHFACPTPPPSPAVGQLWFNSDTESLQICDSISPPSYKTISVNSPESSFSGNDILPKDHDTYDIGTLASPWNEVFADKTFAENVYIRKEDGSYIDVITLLSTSSNEITHNGNTLTDTLNSLYSTGGSNAIITATESFVLTPSKGVMVVKTNASNIIVTVKSMSGLAPGDSFSISNFGTGNLVVATDIGVEFENINGTIVADSITLTLRSPNKWVVNGEYV